MWFFLSFFIGILPLLIIIAIKRADTSWMDFVEHGELALVSIGIAGSALSRIVESVQTDEFFKTMASTIGTAVFLSLFVVFFSAYSTNQDDAFILMLSWLSFGATTLFSIVCIVVALVSEILT